MNRTLTVFRVGVLAVVALASSSAAEWYSSPAGVIRTGTNYFSLPAPPTNASPPVVFAGVPIDNKLAYWCRLTQRWYTYPDPDHWYEVMWHMGHRLQADGEYTIGFEGTQPTVEMETCINPASAGLVFISQPYDHESYWADFRFVAKSNPSVKVPPAQAAANGWIEPYLIEGTPTSGARITLDGADGTETTVKPWKGYWLTVKVGPQIVSLAIHWPTAPAPVSIADVKQRPDGSVCALHGQVVTAAFADWFYVESGERSSGIRVEKPGHGLDIGVAVDIIGTLKTWDGERYIAASTVR